ncbi:hypothetical protein [Sporosarcina sp. YIM B06819]|uniref:hypothetical protein n=1 Tax=Sporosarcina sp. YIM B06819 TaxID=3081769 RepID=UPI00298D333B|nr:hypothetical protein [Sporosarcina sp. YIM B06819]
MFQEDEPNRISHEKEMSARALSRDMFLIDQAMYRQDAREEGRAEGFKIGYAEAIEKGKAEVGREFTHILYAKGYSLAEISDLFNLPLPVIEDYLSSGQN